MDPDPAAPPPPAIFLLSDFGLRDGFVGQMRAVIATVAPRAAVHDLVHELPPHDVPRAAYALESATPWLPDGAVVCAVVDPGVGSGRAAVALAGRRADGAELTAIAPDNGLLEPWLRDLADLHAVRVRDDAPASRTFHGRDVFAPAAARVAAGTDLASLGEEIAPHTLIRLPRSEPEPTAEGWRARTVSIDRFGNLITDLRVALGEPAAPDAVDAAALGAVSVAGREVGPLRATFADVEPGEPVAYVGSSGRLEVALREGNLAASWGLTLGAGVRVAARDGARDDPRRDEPGD